MQLSPEDIANLYDSKIFVVRKANVLAWKLKPGSKLLFVMHEAEFRDKNLTELLKKIVLGIGLPSELAGFGVMRSPVSAADLADFPCDHAIVFDPGSNPSEDPLYTANAKKIFFTQKLAQLEKDQTAKRALWEYLKKVKAELNF